MKLVKEVMWTHESKFAVNMDYAVLVLLLLLCVCIVCVVFLGVFLLLFLSVEFEDRHV